MQDRELIEFRVFISYQRNEREWIETNLIPRLKEWRISYVIDHEYFLPGRRLASTIRDYIKRSEKVIFVCTRGFLASEWCKEELETVRAEDPGSLRAKAIPVVLDTDGVPDLLSDTIWCNLTDDQDKENEWRKLCMALGGIWDGYKPIKQLIEGALQAEFNAYSTLPEISLEALQTYFDINGGAYKRIHNVLERHMAKEWVISNPGNPSHYNLLEISVAPSYETPNQLRVETTEFWYLRWYSLREERCKYIYNEINSQVYVLCKESENYKISANIYPQPSGSLLSRSRAWLQAYINLREKL